MGILGVPLQMIRDLKLPRGFSVCELGDQWITEGEHRPASVFYKELGCSKYVALDGNGRGTHTVDLNRPLPAGPVLQGLGRDRFDLVTDFGTGEHVFDQCQVWRTIHELTKLDGYVVFDHPCAGYQGHCFYLIQPCVISGMAHTNGYDVIAFERSATIRGELIRGVLRKRRADKFVVPQQGRYFKDLTAIMDQKTARRGPDWKSKALRKAGVVGAAALMADKRE